MDVRLTGPHWARAGGRRKPRSPPAVPKDRDVRRARPLGCPSLWLLSLGHARESDSVASRPKAPQAMHVLRNTTALQDVELRLTTSIYKHTHTSTEKQKPLALSITLSAPISLAPQQKFSQVIRTNAEKVPEAVGTANVTGPRRLEYYLSGFRRHPCHSFLIPTSLRCRPRTT